MRLLSARAYLVTLSRIREYLDSFAKVPINFRFGLRVTFCISYQVPALGFEIGEAKAAQFQIIHNSDEQVTSILSQETALGHTVDIFTLNKKNGMAVWTKTRSSDLLSGGTPSAQSFYLKCK